MLPSVYTGILAIEREVCPRLWWCMDTEIDTPHRTKLKTNAIVRAYSTSFQLTSVKYATLGIVCSGFNMRSTSRSVIARHRNSSFVGGWTEETLGSARRIRRLPSAAAMESKTFKPAWNIGNPDAFELGLFMIAVGPNSSLFKLAILSFATLNKLCRGYFLISRLRDDLYLVPVSSTAIKPNNIHKLKAVSTVGFVRRMYHYSVLLTKLSLVRSSEALQMNRNKITLFVRLNALYCTMVTPKILYCLLRKYFHKDKNF